MSDTDATTRQPTRYRVTAEFVLATTSFGAWSPVSGKPSQTGFWRGAVLPADVPEHQIRHLVDSGMVEPIGPAPAED
jgi:hypothetical protein